MGEGLREREREGQMNQTFGYFDYRALAAVLLCSRIEIPRRFQTSAVHIINILARFYVGTYLSSRTRTASSTE